ncbi:MAG: zf-HC2 domain-containing protein [Acidobacteriota bacterium]|nr:zf-HC2 domain-containing protein [Blastocatellia bacterium]MDW8241483.1 zf-HC2 domain-containing protein [Acidobacteriota bacterium]
MQCVQYKKLASAYHDRQLDPAMQRTLKQHMSHCRACREYLAQLQAVADRLARLSAPSLPTDFVERTVVAFKELRYEPKPTLWRSLVNFAFIHSRLVSTVCSFLITILCSGAILGQFKPIPLNVVSTAGFVQLTQAQFDQVNGRDDSLPRAGSYAFPRVQRGSQIDLASVGLPAASIVVLAYVRSDGRASLIEVLDPPSSPQLVARVQGALSNLRFRPALADGRPVPTQLVLVVEQIDVRG